MSAQIGQRVKLVNCDEPLTRLLPGANGTVVDVDDAGVLLVDWDDAHRRGPIEGLDRWISVVGPS